MILRGAPATAMLDLFEEFSSLVVTLNQAEIRYALCGGMAMAVHGVPRATEDIDLLIHGDELEETLSVVRDVGYSIRSESMKFARGIIRIERVAKVDSETGDMLVLDLLLVTRLARYGTRSRKSNGIEATCGWCRVKGS